MIRPLAWLAGPLTIAIAVTGVAMALGRLPLAAGLIVASVGAIAGAALFTGSRLAGLDDWRHSAPVLMGITVLVSQVHFEISLGVVLLACALAIYVRSARERLFSAYASANEAAAWFGVAGVAALMAAGMSGSLAAIFFGALAMWLVAWMPARSRRLSSDQSFAVAAPPEVLSSYLADLDHVVDWYPGYTSSRLLDGEPGHVGARHLQHIRVGRRDLEATVRVEEYEPGHRLSSAIEGMPRTGTSTYTFSRDGGGTVVLYEYANEEAYATALTGAMLFVRRILARLRTVREGAFAELAERVGASGVDAKPEKPARKPRKSNRAQLGDG